jgi:hypothetical protein
MLGPVPFQPDGQVVIEGDRSPHVSWPASWRLMPRPPEVLRLGRPARRHDGAVCPWKRRLSDAERSILLSELLLRHPELAAEAEEITSTLLVVEDDQALAGGRVPRVGMVRGGLKPGQTTGSAWRGPSPGTISRSRSGPYHWAITHLGGVVGRPAGPAGLAGTMSAAPWPAECQVPPAPDCRLARCHGPRGQPDVAVRGAPTAEIEAQRVRESMSLVRLPALARPRLTR